MCFTILLNTQGGLIWAKEAPEYVEVVFASIKDNPAMAQLLSRETELSWTFNWVQALIASAWDLPSFPDLLAKVFVYLGEELDHAAHETKTSVHACQELFQVILVASFCFCLFAV